MSKIIADYAGAAGMAIMGNLRNFTQGVQTFAILGFEHGLVKYASTHRKDVSLLRSHFKTAWSLAILSSIVLALIIFIGAAWIDNYLIASDVTFVNLFRLFAISLPFYVLFVFMTSILQGFQVFKKYITLQIIVSIAIFLISAYLIYNYNLTGALYGIVMVPFVQCTIALVIFNNAVKSEVVLKDLIGFKLDYHISRKLLSYSIMALVSALLLPTVAILVRNEVRVQVGDVAAGWWEGILRLSSYYLLFATSLISMYVLPKLSTSDKPSHFRATVFHFYKTILPVLIVGLLLVFLTRDYIIQYLFNEEFDGMRPLFKWQLIGDFIKTVTTVLAFQFVARNDIKRYLIAEIVSVLSFYIFSMLLLPRYGVEGIVMAHLCNYVVYLLVLLILLRKELFSSSY